VLVFQVVGLEKQEVLVENRSLIDVLLGESTSLLSDVVVVGYGVQKKSQITGAIASISNKDFKDQPVPNLACQGVRGRVSGLNVAQPPRAHPARVCCKRTRKPQSAVCGGWHSDAERERAVDRF
jgi:hypothetical protein